MRQKLKTRKQKPENIKKWAAASSLPSVICVFLLATLMLASGCATTTSVKEERQIATLTAIDITDNTLNINADKPFKYTIYKPSDPYKAIVELPDVRLGIVSGKIKSEKAGITEIMPSQTEEPLLSKLEILLSSPAGIVPAYKGTLLTLNIINLEEELKAKTTEKAAETPSALGGAEEAKTTEIAQPEEKPSAQKELPPATSIVKVTIEKEQDVLKLTIKGNGSLNPNVFELDNRTVLDMSNVTLEAPLPKAQSPLKGIRSGKYKNKTRIVLDMKEKTSFTVTSIEDSVIVLFQLPEKEKYAAKTSEGETKVAEVAMKNSAASAEKPAEEGKYKGQKISLDFQDADIGPIFRLLADISGYNFVIDPSVKGKITLKLMNVPWERALDIILQTFGLGKSVEGNIVWIAPIATFTKISEDKTKAKAAEEIAEDITQEILRINYATAGDISAAITNAKLVTKDRGSITMDTRMNALIIKDTQKNINKIKELVKIMDIAKPQVMIEAKIVEVGSDYSESLGIRWGGQTGDGKPSVGFGDVKINSGTFSVNTPIVTAGSSTTNPGGVLGLSLGSANSVQVNLSLSALESVSQARTLSNPKILTMDNESATIQQGQTFFVPTTSSEGTKTEEKTATLSLTVKPKITPDGYIQIDILATDDALQAGTAGASAVINKKSLTTKALVKNGETLVLGGIYKTSTTETEEGVPLLSKIPIFGWLFKKKDQTGPNVKELLIFITPTIVTKP